MRDCIFASIKLSFRFLNHSLCIDLINKFAFGLIVFIKNRQIYFLVSSYTAQRISSLVVRFFEHAIKLSCSAFFT